MYRLAFFIIMSLATHLETQAQTETVVTTNYQKGMKKAFALWQENKISDAANLFERIASAETENWLPSYYAAQVLILDGFTKMKDTEALNTQLKRAQDFINDANAISKQNPEIMVMQALLHTVYVASDGAKYGMTLAPKVSQIYADALKIAPDNPRVVYMRADWGMGSAKYFGQAVTPFCNDLKAALELFANFKPKSKLHPDWGKERVVQIIAESCK